MSIKVLDAHRLECGGDAYPCVIGKGGFVTPEHKREGDLKTPTGTYALREVWYRPDKCALMPKTELPLRAITRQDGWCDDPDHPAYNQHVQRPINASHEHLWRDDDRYDLIVPIGYNDYPAKPGKGSAIFVHVAAPDYEPTEGCIAIAKEDLLAILSQLAIDARIEITPTAT